MIRRSPLTAYLRHAWSLTTRLKIIHVIELARNDLRNQPFGSVDPDISREDYQILKVGICGRLTQDILDIVNDAHKPPAELRRAFAEPLYRLLMAVDFDERIPLDFANKIEQRYRSVGTHTALTMPEATKVGLWDL
jgi:hypothetical protein